MVIEFLPFNQQHLNARSERGEKAAKTLAGAKKPAETSEESQFFALESLAAAHCKCKAFSLETFFSALKRKLPGCRPGPAKLILVV